MTHEELIEQKVQEAIEEIREECNRESETYWKLKSHYPTYWKFNKVFHGEASEWLKSKGLEVAKKLSQRLCPCNGDHPTTWSYDVWKRFGFECKYGEIKKVGFWIFSKEVYVPNELLDKQN